MTRIMSTQKTGAQKGEGVPFIYFRGVLDVTSIDNSHAHIGQDNDGPARFSWPLGCRHFEKDGSELCRSA